MIVSTTAFWPMYQRLHFRVTVTLFPGHGGPAGLAMLRP
jgi:hypothetical protein